MPQEHDIHFSSNIAVQYTWRYLIISLILHYIILLFCPENA
jgi:hypothetical protein